MAPRKPKTEPSGLSAEDAQPASQAGDGETVDVVAVHRAPPVEVDASRLTPRPIGPFKGGIIVNERGRCAVCNMAADHVHTRPGMPDHVHKAEPEGEA